MTLETGRLILRAMDQSDFDAIYAIFCDPKVLTAFSQDSFSREQMQGWIDRNLDHQRRYGYGLFAVILKTTGELIGNCGLEHSDYRDTPCVELGYDFLSRHWNQGYATEAALTDSGLLHRGAWHQERCAL